MTFGRRRLTKIAPDIHKIVSEVLNESESRNFEKSQRSTDLESGITTDFEPYVMSDFESDPGIKLTELPKSKKYRKSAPKLSQATNNKKSNQKNQKNLKLEQSKHYHDLNGSTELQKERCITPGNNQQA